MEARGLQRFSINREIEPPAKLDVYREIDEIMPWRSKAACLGVGSEIFFGHNGQVCRQDERGKS